MRFSLAHVSLFVTYYLGKRKGQDTEIIGAMRRTLRCYALKETRQHQTNRRLGIDTGPAVVAAVVFDFLTLCASGAFYIY